MCSNCTTQGIRLRAHLGDQGVCMCVRARDLLCFVGSRLLLRKRRKLDIDPPKYKNKLNKTKQGDKNLKPINNIENL